MMTNELKEKMQKAAIDFVSKHGFAYNNFMLTAFAEGARFSHNDVYEEWQEVKKSCAIADELQKELKKEIERLKPLVEWVSVDERLPEDGDLCVCKDNLDNISLCKYSKFFNNFHYEDASGLLICNAQFWRKIEP